MIADSPAVRTPRGDLWRDVWPLPGTRSALSSERNPQKRHDHEKITIHCARSLLLSAPAPVPRGLLQWDADHRCGEPGEMIPMKITAAGALALVAVPAAGCRTAAVTVHRRTSTAPAALVSIVRESGRSSHSLGSAGAGIGGPEWRTQND